MIGSNEAMTAMVSAIRWPGVMTPTDWRWMNDGGRPEGAAPADVTILLNDRILGTVRVTRGFHEYAVPIPADVAADAAATGEPVRLTLRTASWNPRTLLGTPDDRELGVMVDRVAVR